jgi:uncharacterized protein (DUF58 family)
MQTGTARVTRIRETLTTRGRAFLAAGSTLILGGLLLGFADISRVGVLLAVLPLLAAISSRRRNSMLVSRTVHPARLVVDQSATVELVFTNDSSRRTQLRLAEERIDHVLGPRPRLFLPGMGAGEVRSVEYKICSPVRGRHRLGPLRLYVRDPFGLSSIATSLPSTTDVLVLPRIEVLPAPRLRGDGLGVEGAVPHMLALHGEDDVAIRSYRYGDDLRRIHWPATAHRSELMVRQEDRPAKRRAVIILDSRTDGHQGSGDKGSLEWAVTAAASVAAHLSERAYSLHLVTSQALAEGTAIQSVDIDSALATLAVTELGSASQFDDVLHWAYPLTSGGGVVVVIATDHDETVLERIVTLRQRGTTGLLFILDSASFERGEGPLTDRTLALADMAAAAGWSTCVVGPGMSVAQAWDAVSTRAAAIVGAGP